MKVVEYKELAEKSDNQRDSVNADLRRLYGFQWKAFIAGLERFK